MGIIIAKFRKQKTTLELLEKLENDITSLEEFRKNTEQTQKRTVGRFIVISVLVYTITALVLYFYFFPASAYERAMYIIPLIILPVLLILIKKVLSWYYNRKITNNQKKLSTLKDEKKKILNDVMEKETYKVAKTILEKFAPEQVKKPPGENPNKALTPLALTPQNSVLRYRGAQTNRLSFGVTPINPRLSIMPSTPKPGLPQTASKAVVPMASTPLALPGPILSRDRSVLDKMVDYLLGDGPNNRYALICQNCSNHNGMALKEQFEYCSFYCAYCKAFNPAHKKKPVGPKLEPFTPVKSKSDVSDTEPSEQSDSGNENESPKQVAPEELSDCEIKRSDNESSPVMDVDVNLASKEASVAAKD